MMIDRYRTFKIKVENGAVQNIGCPTTDGVFFVLIFLRFWLGSPLNGSNVVRDAENWPKGFASVFTVDINVRNGNCDLRSLSTAGLVPSRWPWTTYTNRPEKLWLLFFSTAPPYAPNVVFSAVNLRALFGCIFLVQYICMFFFPKKPNNQLVLQLTSFFLIALRVDGDIVGRRLRPRWK